MSNWPLRSTLSRIGRDMFDDWCAARKGTRWSGYLSPDACARAARFGDPEAKAVMEKFTALAVKRRITK